MICNLALSSERDSDYRDPVESVVKTTKNWRGSPLSSGSFPVDGKLSRLRQRFRSHLRDVARERRPRQPLRIDERDGARCECRFHH
jgi:hypothetical protein